jgi:aminopeptidase N
MQARGPRRALTFVVAIGMLAAGVAAPRAGAAQQTPPAANPNTDRMANDVYTRSHDYDLVHQRIAVSNFDWDSTSFDGRVATTLVSLRPALDSVILDVGALLRVHTVADARGASLRFDHRGDTLVVHLAAPAAFGDTVRFTVAYHGVVESGHGLTYIGARAHTPRQIWSQGEDMDNHFWFPTYDFPNDKMTWELAATVPTGYEAVSNGALVSDTRAAGGVHTMTWSQDKPSATYLVSLVVAPLAKIHDSWQGVPVDYYTYHADSALAWRLFHVTPDMIATYSRLTGIPYPWQKYAQTTVADFFGGMENVSATTLVDWLPDARAYQDRPWYQYILIPHELAHQWFGDYVTTENWANTWLNEGFAEFMPGQYWTQKLGAHAGQDYYADEYRQFMAIDARRRMPLAAMRSNNIYPKGALVLEMLEHYLGDQRLWASLHHYLVAHAEAGATTDDLRQAVLDATGENLAWFWEEWIYSAGYPDFHVASSYDAAAQRLTLVVQQTQRDTLKADSTGMRYVVPEAFRMPVAIRVGTAAGDVVRNTWIEHREDTIVVDGVRSAPTMVVFDDGNRILKSLTFDEPTAWLANQLARDTDLWDRRWVIEQLAARTTDAAAGAALSAAATGADYYLTRADAVGALAHFAPAVALAAVQRAARDTSSQVRQAAIETLGALGGAVATQAVRAAWTGDSSYIVRAAALTSLARLDASNRHALALQGLATPSYQDAIQNAAISLVVATGDTAAIPQLQAIIGDQQLPLQALGVLAGSAGSAAALAALTTDLNDARPYVRQWTLGAMEQRLDPAKRLAALEAAQPGLTHADTKAGVARAIAALHRPGGG